MMEDDFHAKRKFNPYAHFFFIRDAHFCHSDGSYWKTEIIGFYSTQTSNLVNKNDSRPDYPRFHVLPQSITHANYEN